MELNGADISVESRRFGTHTAILGRRSESEDWDWLDEEIKGELWRSNPHLRRPIPHILDCSKG
jgi:hypothetical protein